MVYVWALEQERNNEKSNYLNPSKEVHCSNSECEPNNESTEFADSSSRDKEAHLGEESLPIHVNRTQFKAQDLLVPWHLRKKEENMPSKESCGTEHSSQSVGTFLRYYHVFVENELQKLIETSRNSETVKVIDNYYDKGNWCVIFEKLK